MSGREHSLVAVHAADQSERRPAEHHVHQPEGLSSGHSLLLEGREERGHVGRRLVVDEDEDAVRVAVRSDVVSFTHKNERSVVQRELTVFVNIVVGRVAGNSIVVPDHFAAERTPSSLQTA